MALSDSRLFRNIGSPWKRCSKSANPRRILQVRHISSHDRNHERQFTPVNLLSKFQASCQSLSTDISTQVSSLRSCQSKCALQNQTVRVESFGEQSIKKSNQLKEIPKENEEHVDSSHIAHLLCTYGAKRWRKLGQGSFGTVIHAKYKGQEVAVKLIPKKKQVEIISLRKEANFLGLSHTNVVRVLQVISNAQHYGIVVMEQCFGLNLQVLLEDPYFNIDPLKRMHHAIDIASGISFCHDNHILHLDIKPQNIMVCSSNVCKLCDFGSSHNIREEDEATHCNVQISGTMIYMDPEILQRRGASKQSDIFSYGITLWQLLSRETPYITYSLHQHTIIYKVVSQELRPRDVLTSHHTDEDYVSLYKWCWQQKPPQRPQSMVCIIKELLRIYSQCLTG